MKTDVEALVRDGLSVATSLARRMEQRLGGAVASDDLLSLVQPVLLEVARTHDPEKAPFLPYLTMKLKWAMLDEVRRLRGRGKARRRAAACAAMERVAEDEAEAERQNTLKTEEEYQGDLREFLAKRAAAMVVGAASAAIEEGEQESPEEGMQRRQLQQGLIRAVEQLPDRQRALVKRHYFGDEKFEAIAEDLGISKSWASRQHTQAMESLAKSLRESF